MIKHIRKYNVTTLQLVPSILRELLNLRELKLCKSLRQIFSGGELFFPEYDYEFECSDNSMIIIPSYVEHGVRKVSIKSSDYYDGYGRYCMTQFLASVPAQLLPKK